MTDRGEPKSESVFDLRVGKPASRIGRDSVEAMA